MRHKDIVILNQYKKDYKLSPPKNPNLSQLSYYMIFRRLKDCLLKNGGNEIQVSSDP